MYIRQLPKLDNLSEDIIQAMLYDDGLKYRRLIEHLPAIIYIAAMDDFSSTIYTSPQVEAKLGFSQAEWIADKMLWLKQIHPEDRKYVLDELSRVRAGGDPKPCEYRMLTRHNREIWFSDESSVEYSTTGRPLFLYGIMLDITERKRLELELSVTKHRLAESIKMKLSAREIMLLHLLTNGENNHKISCELAISERTVRYWLKSLYLKLGVSNRTEAVVEAARLKLD